MAILKQIEGVKVVISEMVQYRDTFLQCTDH